MKVSYKHSVAPTCFGQSFDHPQGSVLQRMDTADITKVCEPRHACRVLYFSDTEVVFKYMYFKKYIKKI